MASIVLLTFYVYNFVNAESISSECINECSCTSAQDYMNEYGLDFSGGLCSSTLIEFDKINNIRCAPDYTLLIRDSSVQADDGGSSIEGAYFRRLNDEDMIPTICFVGGSDQCKIEVDSEFMHLTPFCVNYCRFQIEQSLTELRKEHKIRVAEWKNFRKKNMNEACCKTAHELNQMINEGEKLHLVCAMGFEKKEFSGSLGAISHKPGYTDCLLERKVIRGLTTCVCTMNSCIKMLNKKHFVINGKLPEHFCKSAPYFKAKPYQLYCQKGYILYDRDSPVGVKITNSRVAKIKFDGCEITTEPAFAFCRSKKLGELSKVK